MPNTLTRQWIILLNEERRKPKTSSELDAAKSIEHRTEIERDHDRILFCTPVRRMADKTQVFPLDRNDSVRNRLTHSHEVSNLARSIGITLAQSLESIASLPAIARNLPAVLAAVGLVHDLGNPPFGHQGEHAIQSWFRNFQATRAASGAPLGLPDHLFQDFLKFEGNAQTFRLVTRLQLINDNYGLDLTYASLAGMMKYPTASTLCGKDQPVARKKFGFFHSEASIAADVLAKVGLEPGLRHPVAYLMEACDDIAYAVLDAEDAIKKGLASFSDLMAFLRHGNDSTPEGQLLETVVAFGERKHRDYRDAALSPAELNDVSMQRFRVRAIGEMINAAIEAFRNHEFTFVSGTDGRSLLQASTAIRLRDRLCDFSRQHAFVHRSVLEVELRGYNTLRGLMDIFWSAIEGTDPDNPSSINTCSPYHRYVFSRISENYRRVYFSPADEVRSLPVRYRQFLLLTDMISGMTDSFAISLLNELNTFKPTTDSHGQN